MSTRDDNVFARWSRRKQAVRDGDTPTLDEEQTAFEAAEAEPKPVDQPVPEVSNSGEPLPNLEDLTADSDLSAFLRKGVPEALKSAALRKMWSLDPAIRDHIGPSEYAWDFNQPGSMAGFGPLEANESVAEFLSTMSDGPRAGLARTAAPPSEAAPQVSDIPPEPSPGATTDEPVDVASPTKPLASTDPATNPEPPSLAEAKVAAQSESFVEPVQTTTTLKRHGGAMPQ